MDPDAISPSALAALLSRLPAGHPLVVAARLGVEMGSRRADAVVEDDYDCDVHRHHPVLGPSELALRRYPPTGDRRLWVLFGPAGPPRTAAGGEAAA